MMLGYPFEILMGGVRVVGARPSIIQCKSIFFATKGEPTLPEGLPTFSEFGNGQYVAFYDAATYGDALALINLGESMPLLGMTFADGPVQLPKPPPGYGGAVITITSPT